MSLHTDNVPATSAVVHSPFMSGGNSLTNSLKLDRSVPSWTSGQFSRMLRIAWSQSNGSLVRHKVRSLCSARSPTLPWLPILPVICSVLAHAWRHAGDGAILQNHDGLEVYS